MRDKPDNKNRDPMGSIVMFCAAIAGFIAFVKVTGLDAYF